MKAVLPPVGFFLGMVVATLMGVGVVPKAWPLVALDGGVTLVSFVFVAAPTDDQ